MQSPCPCPCPHSLTHSLTHAFIHLFIHSYGQSVGQSMSMRHNHRPRTGDRTGISTLLLSLLRVVVVVVVDRQDTFPDVVIKQACELLRKSKSLRMNLIARAEDREKRQVEWAQQTAKGIYLGRRQTL